jgi:hypothetical protein
VAEMLVAGQSLLPVTEAVSIIMLELSEVWEPPVGSGQFTEMTAPSCGPSKRADCGIGCQQNRIQFKDSTASNFSPQELTHEQQQQLCDSRARNNEGIMPILGIMPCVNLGYDNWNADH